MCVHLKGFVDIFAIGWLAGLCLTSFETVFPKFSHLT